MDNRIKEIKNIEIKIRDIQIDTDSHFKTLGEFVSDNETGEYHNFIKKKKLSSGINELKKMSQRFDDAVKKKEKVVQFRKRVSEINDEIRQAVKKNDEIEKENEKHYIGIAETLFTAYRRNPDGMRELKNYFMDFIETDKKNRQFEKKIQEINNKDDSSLLAKFLGAGEKTILYSRRKINTAVLISAFKKAGKKMCLDKIYEASSNQEIEGMFAAYKSNRRIQEDLQLKTDTLDAEKNNFIHDIEEILEEFGGDPELFIKDILKEKEDYLKDFGKKIYDIIVSLKDSPVVEGEHILDEDSESLILVEGISNSLNEIDELENNKAQLLREIEIEKLGNEIKENTKQIAKKTAMIDELEKEIENLNSKIASAEVQIEKLKNESANS